LLSANSGKACFVPRVFPEENCIKLLRVQSLADLDSFPADNKFRIPEPPLQPPRQSVLEYGKLDLVLCPGVAFDVRGGLLGHGKGYYDRFIRDVRQRFRAHPTQVLQRAAPVCIGLALREQILEQIPMDDVHDERLDDVLFAPPEQS